MVKRFILVMIVILALPLFLTGCYEEKGNSSSSLGSFEKKPSEYDNGISFDEAMKKNKPIVVKFYVDWCGACKRVAPVFDYVRSEFSDEAEFVMVNSDLNPELTNSFDVRAFPTIFIVNPSTKAAKEIPYQNIFIESKFLEYLRNNSANFKP